ncbi:helix-turn-helix transcriptional regulator [Kitasatospora herbaricolor]|uniref:Helix-turn-helix transcriptional regulator n=1 Tax=Kitasatospora herbaricolor TaxID=68217 RepID=A0ABZ1W8G2_9ACTN|nr:helix-turn-helix transcriptional regulator [Kitasatospora herbaricolor]
MPPRINPSARHERLGSELRKLREKAGLTARAAANLIGSDQAQMSNLEAGRVGASAERIRRLAFHYACDDMALIDALVAMATDRTRGWWEDYRDVLSRGFLDLAEAEFHAVAVRSVRIAEIPGFMQTEAHARAVFNYYVPGMLSADLEAKVAFRVQRRVLLQRTPATDVQAVIHEAALRMNVGGTRAAREQLTLLLDLSERPNVEIRVIPFSATEFAGASGSMYYLAGPVPQLDTLHFDSPVRGTFVDAEALLSQHRRLFAKVQDSAHSPQESRDFIIRILKER